MLLSDKLNSVDYQWFLVRTKPGHETELCAHIEREKDRIRNILEVYCPTHTKVYVRRGDNERRLPLFDGYVFVLATQSALVEFLCDNSSDAYLRYNRKRASDEKATACTIPESYMRAFRDYNENYADKVIVLERPYTDYAFNTKTDEPNEIVRVVDGPLAGQEGYVCRFHGKKGLIFRVLGMMPGSWLTASEDGLLINLARYEHDTPGYVKENWPRFILRPFLTPTSGTEMEGDKNETELPHKDFTEIIRRMDIAEEVYYPSRQENGKVVTTYYAHVSMREADGNLVCFANWDGFLHEYFLTAGKANKKLVSGRTFRALSTSWNEKNHARGCSLFKAKFSGDSHSFPIGTVSAA